MLYASCSRSSSTLSRLGSGAAVCSSRAALNFCGSTSAGLPGSSTPWQLEAMLAISSGDASSDTATASPPANSTACAYCGKERALYSGLCEYGSGMAMRGFISAPQILLSPAPPAFAPRCARNTGLPLHLELEAQADPVDAWSSQQSEWCRRSTVP